MEIQIFEDEKQVIKFAWPYGLILDPIFNWLATCIISSALLITKP